MSMDDPGIELIADDTVYRGYLGVARYRLRHRLFDGGWSEIIQREVCLRGHAVGVLLYDPAADAVVLIEQFRAGAAASVGPAWLTEIVAGMIEEGEAPEDVARRESEEEAGCTPTALEFICDYFPSPGVLAETVTLYCGRVDCAGIGTRGGAAEEHEDIRILTMDAGEAIRLLDANHYRNSITIIALGWLARHRAALRTRWMESAD